MADKKHRNPIRIATTTQAREADAISALLSRELLYNRNNKTLGIVLEDEEGNKYRQIVSGLVDEVNITKNENYETKLKEDIVIDTVTTQADHKGIDWKSQYKIAETTPERTVILLCTQDIDSESDIGVIGGEILEVGQNVFGHYQISLTSTGSRLLKGATTFEKKARLVLAKYNGNYYYGIKFKSAAPANIYFAGWSKIPGGISAPSYTTYNDGDLSEVIELDDDSDTGTEVIDFEFFTYDDISWEFLTAPYVRTEASSSAQYYPSQQNLIRRTDFKGVGTISFGTGYAHNERYYGLHWYDKIDYTYNGNSWNVTHAITFGSDIRGSYLQSGSSGVAGYISIPGNYKGTIGFYVYNNTNSTRNIRVFNIKADRFAGTEAADYVSVPAYTAQWVMFYDLPAGEYYFYQSGGFRYYSVYESYTTVTETVRDSSWNQNGDNKDYSLTNGLKISSSKDTSWYEDASAGNNGYIDFAEAGGQTDPAMTLTVLGKAFVKVGFTSIDGNNTNIRISETLDTSDEKWSSSVSVDNSSTTTIKECVYDYNSNLGEVYIMNEIGPVRILYVEIDYDDSISDGTAICDIIKKLPDTGEDGSPHIIRLSGEITKEAILSIAQGLKDPTKQIILDLSKCTMEEGFTDWTSDGADLSSTPQGGLYSAFMNCVSLREFYYPRNVTSTGGNTFKNCTFLRKVVFNPEMQHIGASASIWSWDNNVLFSGARVKTIFLPKSVNDFGGYPFAYSNIVNVFFEEGSAFINGGNFGQWNTFVQTKEALRFRCPSDLYNVWKNNNLSFQGYGADGDGVSFISSSCLRKDHVVLWEGVEEDIDYTAKYEDM